MASIFSLYGSVFIDNEKANKSIEETTRKGKESSTTFAEKFGEVSKNALKIGGAIVGASAVVVGGLTKMAEKTASYADDIDEMSVQLGMSKKGYQEWKYVLDQTGTSIESMKTGMKTMTASMASLAEGGKKGKDTLGELGITIDDLKNKSQEEIFEQSIIALQKMPAGYEKARLAQQLFGKQGQALLPILNATKGSLGEMKEEANRLGLVMSDSAINGGAKLGDAMDALKMASGALFNRLGSALLPIIQKVVDLIMKNMPTIQKIFDTLAPVLAKMLGDLLPPLLQLIEQVLPILMELFNAIMPIIMEIVKGLMPIFIELLKILLPPIIQIIQALLPALMPLIKALVPLLVPILELLAYLIEKLVLPLIPLITAIANMIATTLVNAIKKLTPVVNAVVDVFKAVFSTIGNIVKVPINWMIDGINSFIKMLNKIKIPDWVPKIGGKGFNLPTIPRLKVGIDYVPYDDFPAILHRGERVLTAKESREESKALTNTFNNNITIEKLEVRDDQDITRIAEELYYLQKKEAI